MNDCILLANKETGNETETENKRRATHFDKFYNFYSSSALSNSYNYILSHIFVTYNINFNFNYMKDGFYNRLARKIAVANLDGAVRSKK